MTCRHYKDGCTLGLYGGRPSPGVCRRCTSYRGPWRGAGDAVRSLVRLLFLGRLDVAERLAARAEAIWARVRARRDTPGNPGASGGCGCKARQQKLNDLLPLRSHANRLHRN